MTTDEFLAWNSPGPETWQLVDGEPQAMAPGSRTHGTVQSELARLLGNHLATRDDICSVVTEPGIVPRVRASHNVRVPDLVEVMYEYYSPTTRRAQQDLETHNSITLAELSRLQRKNEDYSGIVLAVIFATVIVCLLPVHRQRDAG